MQNQSKYILICLISMYYNVKIFFKVIDIITIKLKKQFYKPGSVTNKLVIVIYLG